MMLNDAKSIGKNGGEPKTMMNITPRKIYYDISPYLAPRLKFTLSSFWWDFLSTSIPGPILDPLFDTTQKRSRRLTTMLNCSAPNSFPAEFYKHLEENLNVDDFQGTVKWTYDVLNHGIDPEKLVHYAMGLLADAGEAPFSSPLLSVEDDWSHDRLLFAAAYRLTWAGFLALYGQRKSERLAKLRKDPAVGENALWLQQSQSYSPAPAAEGDGWYAVANWTDEYICMNDRPMASYDGSHTLADIPNGTILYITEAPNYKGLHWSAGQWGHTEYGGQTGYVPLNMTVKLLVREDDFANRLVKNDGE